VISLNSRVLIRPQNPKHYRLVGGDGSPLLGTIVHVAPPHSDSSKDRPMYWVRIEDEYRDVLSPFFGEELEAVE
jgi:hypothetical protein